MLPVYDFTNDAISPLILKLQKESSKRIFLVGDFKGVRKLNVTSIFSNHPPQFTFFTIFFLKKFQ